jgi:hypothetical protein
VCCRILPEKGRGKEGEELLARRGGGQVSEKRERGGVVSQMGEGGVISKKGSMEYMGEGRNQLVHKVEARIGV